jgi:hypothetical protein
MFLATVITDRPATLQTDQWALRDDEPFRAHVASTIRVSEVGYPGAEVGWLSSEVLVVDVLQMELLTELYGYRDGLTILVGLGETDDLLMAEFYRTGYCNAFSRVDRYDPRLALMAILDRIRRGQFRSVERVLTRA